MYGSTMYGSQCVVLAYMLFVWFYNVWLYDCQHIEDIVVIATLNIDWHIYFKHFITVCGIQMLYS